MLLLLLSALPNEERSEIETFLIENELLLHDSPSRFDATHKHRTGVRGDLRHRTYAVAVHRVLLCVATHDFEGQRWCVWGVCDVRVCVCEWHTKIKREKRERERERGREKRERRERGQMKKTKERKKEIISTTCCLNVTSQTENSLREGKRERQREREREKAKERERERETERGREGSRRGRVWKKREKRGLTVLKCSDHLRRELHVHRHR